MVTVETLGAVLLVAASVFFSLVAVVGFYRLPDVYARAHAASKSETLGALLGLSAAAVAFGPGQATFKLALLGLFVLVTGPTAVHAIVRAADADGTVPWTTDRAVADGGTPEEASPDGLPASRRTEDGGNRP